MPSSCALAALADFDLNPKSMLQQNRLAPRREDAVVNFMSCPKQVTPQRKVLRHDRVQWRHPSSPSAALDAGTLQQTEYSSVENRNLQQGFQVEPVLAASSTRLLWRPEILIDTTARAAPSNSSKFPRLDGRQTFATAGPNYRKRTGSSNGRATTTGDMVSLTYTERAKHMAGKGRRQSLHAAFDACRD